MPETCTGTAYQQSVLWFQISWGQVRPTAPTFSQRLLARDNWQGLAEEREQIIQEQRAWITELEQGKAWLEEQWRNWQRIAEERKATIRQQEATIRQQEVVIRRQDEYLTKLGLKPLIRLAIRLGFLRLNDDEG